jgi:hypothetical protein
VQGQPQVEQGGAAGQAKFPAVGIGDRQLPVEIGVQLDRTRAQPEPPRLAVVQGGRLACRGEQGAHLLGREAEGAAVLVHVARPIGGLIRVAGFCITRHRAGSDVPYGRTSR